MHISSVNDKIETFIENHGISGSTLKLIAVISMLIDHTGASVIARMRTMPAIKGDPELYSLISNMYRPMRSIGRIAFPIFCFLIVEGFLHTRSQKKYAARLFLFALISEIPFDFALRGRFYAPYSQNVYFTLLIGLLVLMCFVHFTGNPPLQLLSLLIGPAVAYYLKTDYSWKGVFLIEGLYLFRYTRLSQCLVGAVGVSWEPPAPWGFLPVLFYNGKRGLSLKYFFYWFYPVHLMVLGVLSLWILPHFLGA